MKVFINGKRYTIPQVESNGKQSNPLCFELIASPCKKRPDSKEPCLVHTIKINGKRIPKNNTFCETCIYIPGNKKKEYLSDIEIIKRIIKDGIKLTSTWNTLPSINKKINWKSKCFACEKPLNRKYQYCRDCHKVIRMRTKRFKKDGGLGLPPIEYLHRGIKKWREEK
jgi:hypothetical protein